MLPDVSEAQLQALRAAVDDIAGAVGGGDVVTLEEAVSQADVRLPGFGGLPGGKAVAALAKVDPVDGGMSVEHVAAAYVATPSLLAHYGISAADFDPTADILTSRTDLDGLHLAYGPRQTSEPKIVTAKLPAYTSAPNTLITTHAVQALGLETRPAAWLVEADRPLTGAQTDAARKVAAAAGLTIETRDSGRSLARLGQGATAAGILLALGVLAMTVGLIRSETAGDLRILTATGASGTTRRAVTGATAGTLALLGAVLGTAGAYLALAAWHRGDLDVLGHPPLAPLALILVGLPLVAGAAGWALAGREPSAIARRPLE